MQFAVVYDPVMTRHRCEKPHPEVPERITAIYQKLMIAGYIDQAFPVKSREAEWHELTMAHSERYLRKLHWKLKAPNSVRNTVAKEADHDVYVSADTLLAAKLAAGSTIELVYHVLNSHRGKCYGLAIVRPPGHHAGKSEARGFCFFNNVALAAKLTAARGKNVLIVDWDVHAGNGTEEIVKGVPGIHFVSFHRSDNGGYYPGRIGRSEEYDNIKKVGFSDGPKSDSDYLEVFEPTVTKIARDFTPDIILVSAGFDAAQNDPVGGYLLTPHCYHKMTKVLMKVCNKIVLVLEGGYNLESMANCCLACVETFYGKRRDFFETSSSSSDENTESYSSADASDGDEMFELLAKGISYSKLEK